jgi:hypothetical protein
MRAANFLSENMDRMDAIIAVSVSDSSYAQIFIFFFVLTGGGTARGAASCQRTAACGKGERLESDG